MGGNKETVRGIPDFLMTDSEENQQPNSQVEAAYKAFEQDFERFARFRTAVAEKSLALAEAESWSGLGELRSRLPARKARWPRQEMIVECG